MAQNQTVDLHDAIFAINPEASFTIERNKSEGWYNVTWKNGTAPISNEDIDAKKAELESEL